jgi:hypothetical protein
MPADQWFIIYYHRDELRSLDALNQATKQRSTFIVFDTKRVKPAMVAHELDVQNNGDVLSHEPDSARRDICYSIYVI